MHNCSYKIGDATVSIVVVILLLTLFGHKAVTEHWAWAIADGALILSFVGGALLNKRARARDRIRQIRDARQVALGVPPDEVA